MDLTLTAQELEFRDELRAWLSHNVPAGWQKQTADLSMEERFRFLCGWQKTLDALRSLRRRCGPRSIAGLFALATLASLI